MPRRHQVDREQAAAWGAEAVRIIDSGHYRIAGCDIQVAHLLAAAVQGTVTYPPGTTPEPTGVPRYDTSIAIGNETTLAAARRLLDAGHTPVALNFASATHPGGGFLSRARAQEESLCWSSGLYACLRGHPMYPYHQAARDPLYTDYLIYSPAVPVFRDDDGALLPEPWPLAFLTSAAPLARVLPEERHAEIAPAMRQRIAKVLATGLAHGHDAIVLGAWGCGAFGNDGEVIAELFREALSGPFQGSYRRVEFAILDWSEERRFIGPFERALGS